MARRWLALVLSCIMILTLCPVTWAAETPVTGDLGDNVTWSLDVETGELTISGTGPMWDFDTEENLSPLLESYLLPDEGFVTLADLIESIVIESGVTTIGVLAFWMCSSLVSVNIPASVTSIGDQAFLTCSSLESVNIPASVTEIGYAAFSACISLGAITVAAENPYYTSDSDGVLFNKDKTTLIQYPAGRTDASYTIPTGVNYIDVFAFSACVSLQSVIIPAGVEEIYDCAFCFCKSLTSVRIPKSVAYIGESVFYDEDGEGNPLPAALCDIYYGGSAEDWDKIEIAASNLLNGVTIHYNWTDLDGNDEQNEDDLTLLARHIAGIKLLSKEQEAFADVNGKDAVSAGDLTALARNLLS